MINFHDYVNEHKTKYNPNLPYIPDHPCRRLIIRGSRSRKTTLTLNLIENQPDIDKTYLYAKDPYDAKYQYIFNKRERNGIDHFNDPNGFTKYSMDMHDVDKNIDDYNPDNENKILIVSDDIYKKDTAGLFLVQDSRLASNNPLRFRKNLFDIYNKNHDN